MMSQKIPMYFNSLNSIVLNVKFPMSSNESNQLNFQLKNLHETRTKNIDGSYTLDSLSHKYIFC